MIDKKAIIIFVRKPELGKVKSRLASTIGNENALEVYKKLLSHTSFVLGQLISKNENIETLIFYSGGIEKEDLWEDYSNSKYNQVGDELGDRMLNAFQLCFDKGFDSVCIIGSDCPEINTEILEKAFIELEEKDVVIGPADDGGYYLLGMHQLHKSLFTNKQWSTANVFSSTLEDCKKNNLTFTVLETLSDIDYESDLKKFPQFFVSDYQ